MLAPTGVLWLVANRHLPYDPALSGLFRTVQRSAAMPPSA
jgi:16S rRNA (guanine1207-N2)-methyltransferase